MDDVYRHCSSCKKPIPFLSMYYACSVSTCNRKRTGLYFCSVSCWDVHLPEARHREAWAEEKRAPSRDEAAREDAAPDEAPPQRRVVAPTPTPSSPQQPHAGDAPREVLIVASKLKGYVRAASGMNTSDGVFEALSEHVRRLCDAAARVAARDGRKTIMDRDFAVVLKDWID